MRKTEGLVKYPVLFLKPTRMQYDLMVVIFTIPLHTYPWQKCVPGPINIMGCRNVNLCYIVVISFQLLSYQFRRKVKIQQTCVQQYDFMFIVIFLILLFVGNLHTRNKQHVHCVPQ